jgi:hypothetical protein
VWGIQSAAIAVRPVASTAASVQSDIGSDPGAADHRVLGQAVHDVHVGPDQIPVPADVLGEELAVVDDELEVEAPDVGAGVAGAHGVHHHQVDGPSERDVHALDHLQHRLPTESESPPTRS